MRNTQCAAVPERVRARLAVPNATLLSSFVFRIAYCPLPIALFALRPSCQLPSPIANCSLKNRVGPADTSRVTRTTPWQRWGRTTALGVVSAIAVWFAFGAGSPVPLLDWFDLGVHEAGHLVAFPLPEIVMFMAGSFAQVAFPLAMAWYFGLRRRDPAAGGFCLVWAGTSAWDVSVYAADAVTQQLPLIGGGQHDWAYILGHYDALHLTAGVAGGIEVAGAILAVAGLIVVALALVPQRAVRPVSVAAGIPSEGNGPGLTHLRFPVVPAPAPVPVEADPWLEASRLPFRHEGAVRQ